MLSLSELEARSQTSCYNRFDLRGNVLVAAGTNQRVSLVASGSAKRNGAAGGNFRLPPDMRA